MAMARPRRLRKGDSHMRRKNRTLIDKSILRKMLLHSKAVGHRLMLFTIFFYRAKWNWTNLFLFLSSVFFYQGLVTGLAATLYDFHPTLCCQFRKIDRLKLIVSTPKDIRQVLTWDGKKSLNPPLFLYSFIEWLTRRGAIEPYSLSFLTKPKAPTRRKAPVLCFPDLSTVQAALIRYLSSKWQLT